MVSVDTSVVVRLLTNDDRAESKRAAGLFATTDVHVPLTVLLETAWVLRYEYQLDGPAVVECLRRVLGLPNVTTPYPNEVDRALTLAEEGIGFADALHLVASRSTNGFKTLDQALLGQARAAGIRGVTLL